MADEGEKATLWGESMGPRSPHSTEPLPSAPSNGGAQMGTPAGQSLTAAAALSAAASSAAGSSMMLGAASVAALPSGSTAVSTPVAGGIAGGAPASTPQPASSP